MRCLVTGASGFIGRALISHLQARGHEVAAWPRSGIFDLANTAADAFLAEWVALLRDIDVVVHLAGLAHQIKNFPSSERYFRINRDGTLQLAAAAHKAGVKRFIFLSSAKIFGEGGDTTYNESSMPAPQDPYAESKWQAEQLLLDQFAQRLELVILRPPLVYGRHAKANFGNLLRLARLPIPLPFAGIDNRRALIGIDNLVDLIERCLTSRQAVGKSWLCADSVLYSLADIVTAIRCAHDRKPELFRLPRFLFSFAQKLLGPSKSARLFGDFRMDCRDTYTQLDWIPPYSMEQILRGPIKGAVK
jgi:nucleoside-diphosphate-sugar epimerase